MTAAKTLHETLADLGWSSSKTTGRKSGRLVRCDRGIELGVLTASETWAELRARGLVTGDPKRTIAEIEDDADALDRRRGL